MEHFNDLFMQLATRTDISVVWNDFLSYSIQMLSGSEIDLLYQYTERELKLFEHLFNYWQELTQKLIDKHGYYDFCGVFYEDIIQSKYKAGTNGQFFTPQDVSKLMAEMLMQNTGGMINDCACGSGSLLLDAHSKNPSAILVGQDLDPVACKMAVLNFYVSGVRGSVIHMNSLTLESFEAWRVNNYLYHGLPIPHIELVNEREAYHFIGLKHNEVKPIELNKTKETIQTKLW